MIGSLSLRAKQSHEGVRWAGTAWIACWPAALFGAQCYVCGDPGLSIYAGSPTHQESININCAIFPELCDRRLHHPNCPLYGPLQGAHYGVDVLFVLPATTSVALWLQ